MIALVEEEALGHYDSLVHKHFDVHWGGLQTFVRGMFGRHYNKNIYLDLD
jgi:hypothetical protein